MRVAGLVSGGKDSCFNMMECVKHGHTIVALVNIYPEEEGKDELDSYMYQTVGHEGIHLYAEAMALPLFRAQTKGCATTQEMEYSVGLEGETEQHDEVEDLYKLLKRVKEECQIDAVSVGAIASEYQKKRVENICARLDLTMLAYLWHRDQRELMSEMISSGVDAILIKVAAMGLNPSKHLGKTIKEVFPHLCDLHEKYGVHICGEGGEFETFTLNCPLFKRKIKIGLTETRIHSNDAFAPVAYLKLTNLTLE